MQTNRYTMYVSKRAQGGVRTREQGSKRRIATKRVNSQSYTTASHLALQRIWGGCSRVKPSLTNQLCTTNKWLRPCENDIFSQVCTIILYISTLTYMLSKRTHYVGALRPWTFAINCFLTVHMYYSILLFVLLKFQTSSLYLGMKSKHCIVF